MRQQMGLAIAALVLAIGSARAQTAEFAAQMQAINANTPPPEPAEVKNSVLAMLQETSRSAGQCVPTGVETEPATPATADPRYLLGIGSGKFRNAWLAYGRPTGCADGERQRFMLVRAADGTLRTGVLNKGESLASPSLMYDALGAAFISAMNAVRKAEPSCSDSTASVTLLGSRVSSQSSNLSPIFTAPATLGVGRKYGPLWFATGK